MRGSGSMELPTRKQNRLKKYDYSAPNAYFITICTGKRKNLFWMDVGVVLRAANQNHYDCQRQSYLDSSIIDLPKNVPLTDLGIIARRSIEDIPKHYPAISVDHYVIMPNHIHLLLQIHTDVNGRSMIAPTISTVVRFMKGAVSKQAGFSVWQKGFYDHVIRNDNDYQDIWNYIEGNPSKWAEDKLYSSIP